MPMVASGIRSALARTFVPVILAVSLIAQKGADRPRWAAPPIERAMAIADGKTGEPIDAAAMLDELARECDLVITGSGD